MNCPKCGLENRKDARFCGSCGFDLSAIDGKGKDSLKDLPPTVKLLKKRSTLAGGRYLLIAKISEGGMGRIYLAQDRKMQCIVVIKKMIPAAETDDEINYLAKRFKEEARLLFRLKHNSLPRVIDYFIENERFYMIMEYIDGQNFSQYIAKKPGHMLSVEEAVDLLEKVCKIIKFLHKQKPPVIHRDIKPGNIMINKEGDIVLVDFGLARLLDKDKSSTAMVGTFGFSSPEHYTGNFRLSSDLYSLGATFHYLLSGENPRKRIPFDFPKLTGYRDDISPELQNIFDRLLNSDIKERYQDVEELLDDIIRFKKKEFPSVRISWDQVLNDPMFKEDIPSKKTPRKESLPNGKSPLAPKDKIQASQRKKEGMEDEEDGEKAEEPREETNKKHFDDVKDKEPGKKPGRKKESLTSNLIVFLKVILIVFPFLAVVIYSIYLLYPALFTFNPGPLPPPPPQVKLGTIVIYTGMSDITGTNIIVENEKDKKFGYMGKRIYKANELVSEGPPVYKDDKINIQVPQGTYSIVITKQGYRQLSFKNKTISPGKPLEIGARLEEIPPEVTVKTNVTSIIYVNNIKKGIASREEPLVIKLKSGEKWTITARRKGYESVGEGPLTFKPGEKKEVYMELKKEYVPPTYPTYNPPTHYRPPVYRPRPRPRPRDPAKPE